MSEKCKKTFATCKMPVKMLENKKAPPGNEGSGRRFTNL